jgi:hypothetical protein
MSNIFKVGKQYKLLDSNKHTTTHNYLKQGYLVCPKELVWTCHAVHDGDAETHTTGVSSRYPNPVTGDHVIGVEGSLDTGVWEEVTEH